MAMTNEQMRAAHLVHVIRPLFAGSEPEAVGAALGELVAIFLAGYHPSKRTEARRRLFKLIDDLVPILIEELIEQDRVSRQWQE